jgi:hypothetical protein
VLVGKIYFKVLDARNETDEYFIKHPLKNILFAMMGNKAYDQIIWKKIHSAFEKPFVNKFEK